MSRGAIGCIQTPRRAEEFVRSMRELSLRRRWGHEDDAQSEKTDQEKIAKSKEPYGYQKRHGCIPLQGSRGFLA